MGYPLTRSGRRKSVQYLMHDSACSFWRHSTGRNKFVYLALQSTLSVAAELKGAAAVKSVLSEGLDITIVGDNDFYSQRAQVRCLCPCRLHTWAETIRLDRILEPTSNAVFHSQYPAVQSDECTAPERSQNRTRFLRCSDHISRNCTPRASLRYSTHSTIRR
jgi:hypothetical protein